jgi:type IV secretory pathway TrbD component
MRRPPRLFPRTPFGSREPRGILLGGAPRAIAIAVGTLAAAVGIGLQLWIAGLAIWILGHAASVWLTRTEPQFIGVFGRHLRLRAPVLDA